MNKSKMIHKSKKIDNMTNNCNHKNPITNLKKIHKKSIIYDTIHPSLLSFIKHNNYVYDSNHDNLYLNYRMSKLKLHKI